MSNFSIEKEILKLLFYLRNCLFEQDLKISSFSDPCIPTTRNAYQLQEYYRSKYFYAIPIFKNRNSFSIRPQLPKLS